MEIFTVSGGKKEIQVQSDRPFWRNKGLHKHKIKWQVINGKVNYMSAFELVIQEIENVIKFIENPPFDWKNHPKKIIRGEVEFVSCEGELEQQWGCRH